MRTDFMALVGLDVHKDSIAIAYVDADFGQAPRFLGTTRYSVISVTKALAKLGKPAELSVCHEAGPCGYGLVRALRERGYATGVIAPSRVARKPADRIKTDRRDALLLARLHRSGELTPIVVPTPKDEAIRDLVRTGRTQCTIASELVYDCARSCFATVMRIPAGAGGRRISCFYRRSSSKTLHSILRLRNIDVCVRKSAYCVTWPA